jgi:hypothetical protein
VIEAISPVPPAILQVALEQLVQSDLLEQRGVPPQSRYIFKHALIQDARLSVGPQSKAAGAAPADRRESSPIVFRSSPRRSRSCSPTTIQRPTPSRAPWRTGGGPSSEPPPIVLHRGARPHREGKDTHRGVTGRSGSRRVGTDLSGDRRAVSGWRWTDGTVRPAKVLLRQGAGGGRETRAPGGSVPVGLGSVDGRAQQRASTRERMR